jgi:transcriptional regulator with XRE-family HTH domain
MHITYTDSIKIREHLGLSQQDFANLTRIDVALVEQYEKGELSLTHDIVTHDRITRALLKGIVRRYPEKLKAAVAPVLELAKTYPEGSVMRNFLNSQENWLKLLEEPPQK